MSRTRGMKFTYLLKLDSSGRGYDWTITIIHILIMMASPVIYAIFSLTVGQARTPSHTFSHVPAHRRPGAQGSGPLWPALRHVAASSAASASSSPLTGGGCAALGASSRRSSR